MKAEEARQVADQALSALSQALAAGKSSELTALLTAFAKFHRYSFGNVMLIISQMSDATHVAGFQTWKTLGRFVKRGEKGIAIIAPMLLRKRDEATRAVVSASDEETVLRFRAVHVFDISQTDGEPLPEPRRVTGEPGEMLSHLRTLILSNGIHIVTEALGGSVLGCSRGGTIAITAGLTAAEEFSVLVHEFAHEMLHQQKMDAQTPRPSKTVRETEAEAVAYVVNTAMQLQSGASVDYIQMYQGDEKTLAASLDRVQTVASLILEGLVTMHSPAHANPSSPCFSATVPSGLPEHQFAG